MNLQSAFTILNNSRKIIIRIFLVIIVFSVLSFYFSHHILRIIHAPYNENLFCYQVTEGFFAHLKVAIFSGMALSIPYIFGEIYLRFAALMNRSKIFIVPLIIIGTSLFCLGVSFCYWYLLPPAVKFLSGYGITSLKPMISLDRYVTLVLILMFSLGVFFEMPLVMSILAKAGIVTRKFLVKNRRYAVLIICILAAVITPTPDIFNLALMVTPIIILYEVSIIVVILFEKKT
ncbi:MAG: twin-arginine translocase subunit TatC [Thermodesulfobacteriota bacterium]|nr:twin-arginine translocase subunit TatC [Thermodesulfobacteriota bacterium]